jgi:2-C-methyl-D-erythritol 4-phosphate cytidylyltransferase
LKASDQKLFFMEKYAIIVAGGIGTRMGADKPKQFLPLADKPILLHTLESFISFPDKITCVLVLPKWAFEEWEQIVSEYAFTHPVSLVEGGSTRFESVKNGLDKIENNSSLVAIHDGVRPLVSHRIIEDSYALAAEKGCAIASTLLKESIRKTDGVNSKSVDRSKMRLIQTPQTFQTDLIKNAFAYFRQGEAFTDDASVAEKYGLPIYLFEGSYQNIKITTPEDLLFAEAIYSQKIRR